MLHLHLDRSSALPAYSQLMEQVRHYVASGVLRPGDKLPSIRAAARYLGVNPATVVKAYGELEHAGVLCREHGRGVFVAERMKAMPAKERQAELRRHARSLAVRAVQLDAPEETVLRLVTEELEALRGEAAP